MVKLVKMEKILDEYLDKDLAGNYMDLDFAEDGMVVYQTAAIFCEELIQKNGKMIFEDKKAVQEVYLMSIPFSLIAFFEEVLLAHEAILDFYTFLYEKKYISRNAYLNMLALFQKNKQTFFQRMSNEECWSREKQRDYFEIDDMLGNSEILSSLSDLLGEIVDVGEQNRKATQGKIIQFPMDNISLPVGFEDQGAYQLRIDLKGFKPPIWRRVIIPTKITYHQLHQIIQVIFEWQDSHLYMFQTPEGIIEIPSEEYGSQIFDMFATNRSLDARKKTIDVDMLTLNKIDYIYDFGDDWEHLIKVEKVFSKDELVKEQIGFSGSIPVVIKGKGDAPTEDSRGEEVYIPYSIAKINQRLAKLKKK